jgi:hypothetical protein
MVQSTHLIQIKLENYDKLADPQLFGYGQMRDYCHRLSYDFTGGNSYGVIGDCGTGGWTLSYVLSGRINVGANGRIWLNGNAADQRMLIEQGCYVGNGIVEKGFLKGKSIRQQLLRGLKRNKDFSFEEIVELFELAPSRLDRKIDQIGNERWSASAAVGLAHSKKVFCLPWLNDSWIKKLYPRIKQSVKILKSYGAIVIIPTTRAESVDNLVDAMVVLKQPK